MKKHLILLLIAGLFSLTSCSDDDEPTEERSVVGTWELVEMNPPAFDLEECPEKPLITFHDDGNADWTFFTQDNSCQGSTDNGTWEQNSSTEYTLMIPGYEPFVGNVEFSSNNRFTFSTSYQGIPATLFFEK